MAARSVRLDEGVRVPTCAAAAGGDACSREPVPGAYLGYAQETIIDLVEVRSRRIWDLLAEAHEAGIPLVQVGKGPDSVLIAREPVRVIMGARQDEQEIVLSPALMDGDVVINRDACVFVGDPVHGLAWRDRLGDGPLRLGPLARALDESVRRALGGPPVRVPAAHRERFFEHVYPELRGAVEVVSDGSVELPESGRAQLALAVAMLGEDGAPARLVVADPLRRARPRRATVDDGSGELASRTAGAAGA